MRVHTVLPAFWPAFEEGGPVFTSLHTARQLRDRGFEISVTTTDRNGRERLDVPTGRPVAFEPGICVRYERAWWRRFAPGMALSLWRDIRRADWVHVQGMFTASSPLALFVATLLGRRLLISPHGMLGAWCLQRRRSWLKSAWLRLFFRPLARRALWHATAEQEAREIRALFGDVDIALIPNGLDVDEFADVPEVSRAEFCERFLPGEPARTEGPILAALGRLHSKKGLDIAIDALARLRRTHPQARLAIAGPDDGARASLSQRACELGLEGAVAFLDALEGEAKLAFLAGADVFVLPSHHENFGLVYAEALAARTPVVASIHTPWSEVEEAGCGRWVENDPEAVAQAVRDLLDEGVEHAGRLGRAWVLERFDWYAIGASFARVLRSADRPSAGESSRRAV